MRQRRSATRSCTRSTKPGGNSPSRRHARQLGTKQQGTAQDDALPQGTAQDDVLPQDGQVAFFGDLHNVDSPLEKGHGDAPAGTPGVSLEEGEIKATPLNTGAHSPSPPLNTGAHSPSTSGREDDAAAAAPPAAGQQATAAADGWRGFSLFGGPDGAPPPISFVFGATATATATPSRQQRGKRHRDQDCGDDGGRSPWLGDPMTAGPQPRAFSLFRTPKRFKGAHDEAGGAAEKGAIAPGQEQQLQLQQRPQGPAASQQQQHTELEAPGLLDELRALVARAGPACARDQQAVQQLAQEAAELRAALQASPEAAAAHQGEAALLKARLQETDGLLRNTGQGLVAAAKGLQECQEQLAAAQAEAAAQREQSAAAALLPLAPPLVIAPPAPPPPAEVQRLHEQLAWGEVEVLQLKAALQARDEQAAQAAADSERALVEARQQVHDRDAQVAALQAQVQELQGKLRGAQQQLQGTQRELASAQDKLLVAQAAREAAMSQATLHKQATAAAHEWAAATEADGRRVREASLQGSVGGACGDEMAGALAALHAELAQRAFRVDVPRARQLLARAQDTLERLLQRQ